MTSITVGALVVIFCVAVSYGQSLTCYSCSATGTVDVANCQTPNANTLTCTGATACSVATTTTTLLGAATTSIVRSCSYATQSNGCQSTGVTGVSTVQTCYCATNNCNTGSGGSAGQGSGSGSGSGSSNGGSSGGSGSSSGSSYTCYSCSSGSSSITGNTDTCANPTSNTLTCTGAVCTKTSVSAGAFGISISTTTRGCSWLTSPSTGCQGGGIGGVGGGNTCYCTGNLCNSATRGTVSGITMMALTGLVLAMTVVTRLV